MRKPRLHYLIAFFLLLSCAIVHSSQPETAEGFPWAVSRQALVVLTNGWESKVAEAQMFESERRGEPWAPKDQKMSVNVGRKGLGWGSGLHVSPKDNGPIKQEGDGRSPAGVFRIGSAFGYARRDSAMFIRLPYIPIDAATECVDDVNSDYYNLILNRRTVSRVDWNSSEQMLREDGQYKWGAVVEHNSASRVKKGGSCIFLHVWEGPLIPTSGCTSFAEGDMLAVLRWFQPDANPVLIQLPRAEYSRLREPWKLP